MVKLFPDRLKELPPDVTVQTQDRTFQLHRAVLIPASEWFFRRLAGSWGGEIVQLPDLDGETFQLIVDVIYHNRYPTIECAEDYRNFSQYLDYFGIKVYPLFTLAECPMSLLLEGIIPDEEISTLVSRLSIMKRAFPHEVVVELYRRDLLKDNKLIMIDELLETPAETLTALYHLGYPAKEISSYISMCNFRERPVPVITDPKLLEELKKERWWS